VYLYDLLITMLYWLDNFSVLGHFPIKKCFVGVNIFIYIFFNFCLPYFPLNDTHNRMFLKSPSWHLNYRNVDTSCVTLDCPIDNTSIFISIVNFHPYYFSYSYRVHSSNFMGGLLQLIKLILIVKSEWSKP